jgi:hypothetical protein
MVMTDTTIFAAISGQKMMWYMCSRLSHVDSLLNCDQAFVVPGYAAPADFFDKKTTELVQTRPGSMARTAPWRRATERRQLQKS